MRAIVLSEVTFFSAATAGDSMHDDAAALCFYRRFTWASRGTDRRQLFFMAFRTDSISKLHKHFEQKYM
jgi:hypothetical protein